MKCIDCDTRYFRNEIGWNRDIHGRGFRNESQQENQPVCLECLGRIITSVVNFNNPMPIKEMDLSHEHSSKCDLMIVVGSSLAVVPAANFPKIAKRNGAKLIIINIDPTPLDNIADFKLETSAGDFLSEVLSKLKEEREKDFKYKFITYFLFAMVVGMIPFFIFLLLIFMFHDIPFGELFEKENLKTYGLVALIFLAQNFLFFIYPGLIFDYVHVFRYFQRLQLMLGLHYLFFIDEIFIIPHGTRFIISLILLIIMYEIIGFLLITKKLTIQEKFSYFAFSFILLNNLAFRILVVLFPLTLLLFIPFFHQDVIGRDFIKKNKYILIGLILVLGIYLSLEGWNPFYHNFFGGTAGWFIFTTLLGICLLKLYLEKDNYIVER